MIQFVSASRASPQGAGETPLARSLRRIVMHDVAAHIEANNALGLPTIYNRLIEQSDADILVFVHDDVWIDDYFVADRLNEALARFDVVGVAGNTVVKPGHTKWRHRDDRQLSGSVGHGTGVSRFGPTPLACELLDGVFLAVRRRRLIDTGVRFDEQFSFHHYDLDFSRAARTAGLTVGTWPVAITHQSPGNFTSAEWKASAELYLRKWAG